MPPHPTAHRTQLSGPQRHLYAAGHFGVSFMGMVIPQWVMKFYFANEPGVVNLVAAGIAPWLMLLGRITDGLNDPLVGYLSDSVRTRWGRRKPFMVAGLPTMCLFFLLLWYPPHRAAESSANFWFGTILLVLYFIGFTIYTGPYLALLPEITRTSEERLQLSGLQGIYNVSGLVASSFVTGAVLMSGRSYQTMAWVVAAVSVAAFACPLLGARDDPLRTRTQERPAFVSSTLMTLRNRPFMIYVVSQVLFLMGLLLIVAGLPYAVVTLLGQPEGEAGILTGVALLSGVVSIPLILRAAERYGRKRVYLTAMLWLAAAGSLLALLGPLGRLASGVWLARALVLLSSGGVAGLFALPYAVLSDITDHDKCRTGLDRQGMFFCMQGLIVKAAYALAPMTVTGMLAAFPEHNGVVLSLVGPLAGLFALGAYLVFRTFPEDEVRQAAAAVGSSHVTEETATA